jgi:hypothetical protein
MEGVGTLSRARRRLLDWVFPCFHASMLARFDTERCAFVDVYEGEPHLGEPRLSGRRGSPFLAEGLTKMIRHGACTGRALVQPSLL